MFLCNHSLSVLCAGTGMASNRITPLHPTVAVNPLGMTFRLLATLLTLLTVMCCTRAEPLVENPTFAVNEYFSLPARIKKGSQANGPWLEFEKWIEGFGSDIKKVELWIDESLSVAGLSQCTGNIWAKGCEQINLRIGDGPTFALYSPSARKQVRVIAVLEGVGLEGIAFAEVFPNGIDFYMEDEQSPITVTSFTEVELVEFAQRSTSKSPVGIILNRDLPMTRLGYILQALSDRGAEHFVVNFY